MKKSFLIIFLSLFTLAAGPAVLSAAETSPGADAEETVTIIITATKIETPANETPASSTVIDKKEIEAKRKTSVLELLRSVPGLDVVQSGGPGGQTSVFLRGTNSEHTVVMIDGVEMNNPITPSRSFDFAHLTVDNIERIEVIRGPQSTLYGSDAIGGVINIITRKGRGSPKMSLTGEAGSYNTYREKVDLSLGNQLANYSLAVSRLDSRGISTAGEDYGNEEKDSYHNTTISSRLGVTPTDKFNFDLILHMARTDLDLDNFGGEGGDDPNNVQRDEQVSLKAAAGLFLFNDLWEQKLSVSVTDHNRKNTNDIDADNPATGYMAQSDETYNGNMVKLDWQHNLYLHRTNTLTVGLETEKETGSSKSSYISFGWPGTSDFAEKSAKTTAYYLQDQISLGEVWFTTVGVRTDDHEMFGRKTTYRLASSYLIKKTGTRMKAAYGTGFKAPSLYQLFSASGNEELEPEEVVGWDAGLEQSLAGDKISLGLTYFRNDFKNLIVNVWDPFTWESEYLNVNEAVTRGYEAFVTLKPIKDLLVKGTYTYTIAKDTTTSPETDLLRRPRDKYALDVNYSFLGKANVNLGIVHVGPRDDYGVEPPYGIITLDGYTVVNLAASYTINRRFQVFGRVDNVFNEEYEEVAGYGTPGTAYYIGGRISFGQ